MTTDTPSHFVSPFNGPVEIGLRALCIATGQDGAQIQR